MPEFTDAFGITIVYDVHPAQGAPRAVVQLLHGVGEHAGRYAATIDALTADGYTVYADDHR
ncbi:MAG: alpha/beta hydrolase, partial [Microbacterium sp.]